MNAVDAMLAARAADGDREAFDVLVAKHRYRATLVAHEWCLDRNSVEDVVDEAFVKAFRSIGSFRGDCAFSTWLHRIVINAARDLASSKQARAGELPLTPKMMHHLECAGLLSAADLLDIRDEVVRREKLSLLRRGIERLRAKPREILLLCYVSGAPYTAIAQKLGIKIGTVRSRLNAARAELRKVLQLE